MTPPAPGAPSSLSKICTHAELIARRNIARVNGRRVVHCHGCFDIVHPGHIRHLRHAKAQGDILLVTLTGDEEVKKGTGRPLIPEELRAENLAALDFVDWVYIEQRPTAAELLAEVHPDIYVKGREYEHNNDPRFQAERRAVESGGGRVVFSSGDVVFSSTALIAALEQSVDPFQSRLAQLLETAELQGPSLFNLIASFRAKRVLVVGETILDTYVLCDRPDIAGESPIMTLRPVERRHYDGGAAIIARHLAALGARPTLITPLPLSDQGEAIRHRLLAEGIDVRPFITDRPISEKQRFLVGAQKVMKLDLLEPLTLDAAQQDRFIKQVSDATSGCDAAIIADFAQGLFSPGLLTRTCTTCRKNIHMLAGDVSGRRASLRAMHSMDLLCPSESELRDSFGGGGGAYDRGLPTLTWDLLHDTHSGSAIVTMGPEGLIAFQPHANASELPDFASRLKAEHIPALAPFAIDPLGCGDSLISAATLALASGGSLLAAAFLGSAAAAVQAQRIGNIPISATDLRQAIVRIHSAHMAYAPAEVVHSRSTPIPA